MDKYDGSPVYFCKKDTSIADVKKFFKDTVSESIISDILGFMRYESAIFIRVNLYTVQGDFRYFAGSGHNASETNYEKLFKKIKIPSKQDNTVQVLEEKVKHLEEEVKKLKASSNVKETPKWEMPFSEFFADIVTENVTQTSLYKGVVSSTFTFATEDLAKNAIKALKTQAILLKYRSEFCPEYVPDPSKSENKWCIYFSTNNKKYGASPNMDIKYLGAVYFPKNIALDLVEKLNSGEVVLG